jgi:hypothetical protein
MGGMIKILSYSERESLASMIGELVRESLADGVHPADLSAALTVAASRIGLQYAPNAGVAFAVVMKAPGDGRRLMGHHRQAPRRTRCPMDARRNNDTLRSNQ